MEDPGAATDASQPLALTRPITSPGRRHYCISVVGSVSEGLSTAFEPLELQRHDNRSDFVGELEDQSALYGVLHQIQALGLELREVKIIGSGWAGEVAVN